MQYFSAPKHGSGLILSFSCPKRQFVSLFVNMRSNNSDLESNDDYDTSNVKDGDVRPGSAAGSMTTDEDSQASDASSGWEGMSQTSSSSEISTSSSDDGSNSTASDAMSKESSKERLNVLDLYKEDQEDPQNGVSRRTSISERISNKRRILLEQRLDGPENPIVTGKLEEIQEDQYTDSSDSESEVSDDGSDINVNSNLKDYVGDDEDTMSADIEHRNTINGSGIPIETLVDFGTMLRKIAKHSHDKSLVGESKHHNSHKPKHFTTKEVVREIIKPLCKGADKCGCSFLDLLNRPEEAEREFTRLQIHERKGNM